jgi:hypothetical protein
MIQESVDFRAKPAVPEGIDHFFTAGYRGIVLDYPSLSTGKFPKALQSVYSRISMRGRSLSLEFS